MTRRRRQRGGNDIQKIATATRNINLIVKMQKANPPLQPVGQIVQVPIVKQGFGRRMRGGCSRCLVDKYGTYMRTF